MRVKCLLLLAESLDSSAVMFEPEDMPNQDCWRQHPGNKNEVVAVGMCCWHGWAGEEKQKHNSLRRPFFCGRKPVLHSRLFQRWRTIVDTRSGLGHACGHVRCSTGRVLDVCSSVGHNKVRVHREIKEIRQFINQRHLDYPALLNVLFASISSG